MNIELNGEPLTGNTAESKITTEQNLSDIEVIAEMLRTDKKGIIKKEVATATKNEKKQIKKNLNYLISQGFIDKVNIDDSVIAYRVTDSGLKLLKSIDALTSMLRITNNQD